jgi:hypothetical protein
VQIRHGFVRRRAQRVQECAGVSATVLSILLQFGIALADAPALRRHIMANDRMDRPMEDDELGRSNDEDITGRADDMDEDEEFEDVEEDEQDEEDLEA